MSRSAVDPVSLRQSGDWRILLRCFRYLRPYKSLAIGAYAAMIAINVLTLVIPQFIRWIIDRGIGAKDLRLLGWSVGGLLLLIAIKGIVTYFQGRWSEMMSQGVAYDLRNALHAKLSALSFAFHDRTETGQLLSRAVQDVDRIRFLTGRAILRLVDSGALLIGTTIVLISMNPGLALLSLATMPFLVHRAYEFGRRNRPLSVAIQQQVGVLTTQVEQVLRGARVVKAFAQEERQSELFDIENDKWFDLSAAAARPRSTRPAGRRTSAPSPAPRAGWCAPTRHPAPGRPRSAAGGAARRRWRTGSGPGSAAPRDRRRPSTRTGAAAR